MVLRCASFYFCARYKALTLYMQELDWIALDELDTQTGT